MSNNSFPDSVSPGPAYPASQDQPSKPIGPIRAFWQRHGIRLLFFLTLLSTIYIGYVSTVSDYLSRHGALPQALNNPLSLILYPYFLFPTLAYVAGMLGFLTAHEMGHYFFCRRHGLDATLPYYLPNPLIFGTFGAVIRIRSPIRDKRTLLDVGIAGPLCGFAVALPILLLGLVISQRFPAGVLEETGAAFFSLGEPIVLSALNWILYPGQTDFDIVMSPLAMVGWFGCLVTAINLLPVSQLDGGHILYSVFGRRHYYVSLFVILAMITMSVIFQYYGWLVWVLLVVVLGLKHPPLADDSVRLDRGRLLLAALALLVFIGCFIPVPIKLPEFFEEEYLLDPEIVDPPSELLGQEIPVLNTITTPDLSC